MLVACENTFLLSVRLRAIPLLLASGVGAMALLAARGVCWIGALTLVWMTAFKLCYFGLLDLAERPARLRFAIAFAVGLVHGFGFSGVPVEISLPAERLAPALLGFNLGIDGISWWGSPRSGPCSAIWPRCVGGGLIACLWRPGRRRRAVWECSGL